MAELIIPKQAAAALVSVTSELPSLSDLLQPPGWLHFNPRGRYLAIDIDADANLEIDHA